jgi:hypothetical protein
VRHIVDRGLFEQARLFSLRFACEDCAHFDAERARCVHGYVEGPCAGALERPGGDVAFCKEFELGKRDERDEG